jgi:hypothetical protein
MSEIQTSLGSAIEPDTPQTKVKVAFTNIRYLDNTSNELKTERLIGKLSITQCKDYLKDNPDFIFIDKTHDTESFSVDTIALFQLKGL